MVPLESGRIQPLGLGCASKCKASPMASFRWATQPQVYSDTPSDGNTLNPRPKSLERGAPGTSLGTPPEPPGPCPKMLNSGVCAKKTRKRHLAPPSPPWPPLAPLAPPGPPWPQSQKSAKEAWPLLARWSPPAPPRLCAFWLAPLH